MNDVINDKTGGLIPSDRFSVTYRFLASSLDDACAFAESIAVSNTVEIPRDIVPVGYIEDTILGRVESVEPLESTQKSTELTSSSAWRATLSFHIDSVGRELPQLLNVMFGNASMLRGVKLLDIHLNDDVRERFPEMIRDYGPDTVYLLGGSLLHFGDRLGEGIREIRAPLDAV